MITLQKNAYVMLNVPVAAESASSGVPHAPGLMVGLLEEMWLHPDKIDCLELLVRCVGDMSYWVRTPPTKVLHVHHQPPEADNTEAWQMVRSVITWAMREQRRKAA